jgi:hypothetical protein
MIRKFFLVAIPVLILLSCASKSKQNSLPSVFIQSLQKQDFDLLLPYMPTPEFYKSLHENVQKRSEEEILNYITENKEKIKSAWSAIAARVREKKVNLPGISVKETLFNQFSKSEKLKVMVVVYEYEKNTWDDMIFVIGDAQDKLVLLGIPNQTSFLSMEDKSLTSSQTVKLINELEKPAFQKSLRNRVKQLVDFARDNKTKEFTECMVYRGEDESRKWKSAMTTADPDENGRVALLMKIIQTEMQDCQDYSYNKTTTDQESEGTWIVQPVICGESTVYFAFLRIDGKLLLGDIEIK